MDKYLVKIEFRYTGMDTSGQDIRCKSKTVTIGVFDSFEKACIEGNKIFPKLEERYKLNPNYNIKQRLSFDKRLISDLAYIQTPFQFFVSIETLHYKNISENLDIIENDIKLVKNFKENFED